MRNGILEAASLFCLCGLLSSAPALAQPDLATPGTHAEVVFPGYPSVATSQSITARYLSPIVAEAIRRRLSASGKTIEPRMFDPSSQTYSIYVPTYRPARGYGLLVFVSPTMRAAIPSGWATILDKYGVIFVSAARSGNEESVVGRRVPLALAASAQIKERFAIDPEHVVIGGFSGGARVALRIALAYPDQFHGALLNAGSDPIGEPSAPLPASALFHELQDQSRLAYVTGDGDPAGLALDEASIASMRHWCVGQLSVRNDHGVGHEIASPRALDWAFDALFAGKMQSPGGTSECQVARQREIDSALARIESALSQGRSKEAKELIVKADASYGGLVAPRSIGLADQCACGIFDDGPGERPR